MPKSTLMVTVLGLRQFARLMGTLQEHEDDLPPEVREAFLDAKAEIEEHAN